MFQSASVDLFFSESKQKAQLIHEQMSKSFLVTQKHSVTSSIHEQMTLWANAFNQSFKRTISLSF